MSSFIIEGSVLKKYEGNQQEIIIPEGIEEVADFAFYGCNDLQKISFPNTVTIIGNFAFYNCANLQSVKLSNHLVYLGEGAFSCCQNLKEIALPPRLRHLAKSTFFKCYQLDNVSLNENLKSIGHSAFGFCSNLKQMTLPSSLEEIKDGAFEECTALSFFVFNQNLKKLGNKVFFHCPLLSNIELPHSIKEIGEGALQTHGKLTLKSPATFMITSKMLDCNWNLDWNYSFKMKNGDNYVLEKSYLPYVNFNMWKPAAKIILLLNFLETLPLYTIYPNYYLDGLKEFEPEVILQLIQQKRFEGLNFALEYHLISTSSIEPFFDQIHDREQKAKLLAYHHENETKNSTYSQLENDLADFF